MQLIKQALLFLSFIFLQLLMFADEPVKHLWMMNSFSSIDGHNVEVLGNPEIVDTDLGEAIEFDGIGDRILVDYNPIGLSKAFTVEVIFKPYGNALNQANEPRFIHIQDPNDSRSKRITIEIRVNTNNKMYLDGFLLTDISNLTLIDDTKTHDTEEWMHAAISFENNTFRTYVNGVMELEGEVAYNTMVLAAGGKTSIGARMNEKNWFSGMIKCLKVTQAKVEPADFITVEEFNISNTKKLTNGDLPTVYYASKTKQLKLKNFDRSTIQSIEVYNLHGKKIDQISDLSIINNTCELNLNAGIYFVKVSANSKTTNHKIFIE